MDIFFADESKDLNPQENIGLISILGALVDFKTILFLLLFHPTFNNNVEASDFSTPLIEVQANSNLDIIGRDKVVVLWNRAEQLSKLNDGWDGQYSRAININIIRKFKETLHMCENEDISYISLFPQTNGSLYLDYTKENIIAGITLAENTFIYFKGTIDNLTDKGTSTFTPTNLYDFIHHLHKNV